MAGKVLMPQVKAAIQQLHLMQEMCWAIEALATDNADIKLAAYCQVTSDTIDDAVADLHALSGECISRNRNDSRRVAWERAIGRRQEAAEEARAKANSPTRPQTPLEEARTQKGRTKAEKEPPTATIPVEAYDDDDLEFEEDE